MAIGSSDLLHWPSKDLVVFKQGRGGRESGNLYSRHGGWAVVWNCWADFIISHPRRCSDHHNNLGYYQNEDMELLFVRTRCTSVNSVRQPLSTSCAMVVDAAKAASMPQQKITGTGITSADNPGLVAAVELR